MAGGPAHADDEIPAGGRARILDQVADDLHAVMAGSFVAERRGRAGQGQIVVDRLGHVGHLDLTAAALGDRGWQEKNAVSSPPMLTRSGDAEFLEHGEDVLHLFLGLGGIGARRTQDGTTLQVDILHVANGQGFDLGRIASGDVLEAVAEADDFIALIDAFDRGCRDDAIQTGRRAATHQNSQSAFCAHL